MPSSSRGYGPLTLLLICKVVLFFYFLCAVAPLPYRLALAASTIRIGALLDSNSLLGTRCLAALNLAVNNVNKDSLVLNGTTLELVPANSNCSAFIGAAAAISLYESEVVAIAGPQSSEVSHFVAHMAAHTKIPLVSFAATDPALSEYQFPYFNRLTWSDSLQMAAIASVIHYYGWRSVVTLYTDDDYGKNGIDALSDLLDKVGAEIVYKAGLDTAADNYTIGSILAQLALMESRVFVVHMQANEARMIFSVANYLKMMNAGYVWIVTDAVSNYLDTTDYDMEFMKATQGVIGTRMYLPTETSQLLSYLTQRNQATGRVDLHFHPYELLAYESIWMIAYAIDKFLKQGHEFKFVAPLLPNNVSGSGSDLAQLKVLEDGAVLLGQIHATNFTGITGFVQVDKRGDRRGVSFEIVNRVGTGLRVVGYWINETGCTTIPPSQPEGTVLHDAIGNTPHVQKLQDVVWPGGSAQVPRGWVVPKNGRPLIIGVPNKTGYKEFVTARQDARNITTFHGFCINVFESAISYLPYAVTYTFVSFGNGSTTPNYGELINKIATKEFDAVVGDVTITTARSKVVDFTQPYTASGLVVVVPVKGDPASYAWAFMRPFTPAMWCTTCAFFLLTGIVIWILEHKKNRDFRGRPKKQIVTTLWFIFSTLFFSQREKVKSTLGRAVLVIWLFVVLIVTSSYTASLTSILTVEQLTPTIQGIAGLVASNVPIGYQGGSFVEEYLLQLNVPKERLVPLNTLTSYAKALKKGPGNGGVGAIVDELPYVQLFLSSECDFTIPGQEFTKGGWGFAFPKGSQLAIDISTAILELSENGELQQIHDLWLSGYACNSKVQVQSNELNLRGFWGLFLITGVVSLFCVVWYLSRMIWQYNQRKAADPPPIQPFDGPENQRLASRFRRGASFLKSLASFIEEAEVNEGEAKNSRRDSFKLRSSKERSPIDSTRVSMSERSMESSNRESMASTDDSRAELRDLLRELSVTFNAANNTIVEEGLEDIRSCPDEGGSMQQQIAKKGKPLPVVTKRLNTLKSFIFKPQHNKIEEEENSAGECRDDAIIQPASTSFAASHQDIPALSVARRPLDRRSITFKSMLFRSASGKAGEEASTSKGAAEVPPPKLESIEEGLTSVETSSRIVKGTETPTTHLEVRCAVNSGDKQHMESTPEPVAEVCTTVSNVPQGSQASNGIVESSCNKAE
ncbi:hypothetical protein L7F22_023109 [Adiantum nelumboides]|nr:hypothetical protein [Adiantum nelumboides]